MNKRCDVKSKKVKKHALVYSAVLSLLLARSLSPVLCSVCLVCSDCSVGFVCSVGSVWPATK